MIQFVVEGDRIRFEINLATAENAKLVLSSGVAKSSGSRKKKRPVWR